MESHGVRLASLIAALLSASGAALTHALTVLPTLSLVTPLAVSFPTVVDGGFYGMGGLRRYALECADDLAAENWQVVPGVDWVAGWGQTVSYTNRLPWALALGLTRQSVGFTLSI